MRRHRHRRPPGCSRCWRRRRRPRRHRATAPTRSRRVAATPSLPRWPGRCAVAAWTRRRSPPRCARPTRPAADRRSARTRWTAIAASVGRYEPSELPERTDLGNGELFAALHGERLRHVREERRWLHWRAWTLAPGPHRGGAARCQGDRPRAAARRRQPRRGRAAARRQVGADHSVREPAAVDARTGGDRARRRPRRRAARRRPLAARLRQRHP